MSSFLSASPRTGRENNNHRDSTITLGLVENRLFREGLRSMIAGEPDFEIVGEAAEALEAYAMIEATHPDVLILDLSLRGTTGLTVAREVLRRYPLLRILLLSGMTDECHVSQALDAGVTGYATTEESGQEIFAAIRAVRSGEAYLSPLISHVLLDAYRRLHKGGDPAHPPLSTLTKREREIFDLSVRGVSNQGIASQFSISKRTVETHRAHIMQKLAVHSASDLVRMAAKLGLLQD